MKVFLESHNIDNPFTGFGQFNYHLIKSLEAESGPEFQFVVHSKHPDQLRKELGPNLQYKRYYGLRRYPWARIGTRYDLWHSLNQNTKIEPRYDLPYVLTIHDVNFIEEISDDPDHPRNQRFLEKLRRADAITYISEFAKRSTHEAFEIPEIPEFVIYNGNPIVEKVDTSGFIPDKRLHHPYFFSIGDFWERKNFHLLVELMKHFPDHQLVIAGNHERAYGEKVRQTIGQLDLSERVFLVGRVGDIAKQYYFENCEAFLFPSLREGFGLPPIEAMSFGKPVFLADTTSLPEIGGDTAFYFGSLEPDRMAADIKEGMSRFRSDRSNFENALQQRAASFNWDQTARQYLEVYKQVLGIS